MRSARSTPAARTFTAITSGLIATPISSCACCVTSIRCVRSILEVLRLSRSVLSVERVMLRFLRAGLLSRGSLFASGSVSSPRPPKALRLYPARSRKGAKPSPGFAACPGAEPWPFVYIARRAACVCQLVPDAFACFPSPERSSAKSP